MQAGDSLRWFHMWDYDPPPYVHLDVCLYIVLLPYIDDMLVLFMGIYGGRMGSMHVPNELKDIHVSCVIYFRGDIRQPMGVSHEILFPCGMNFAHLILNLGKQFMEGWIGEHLAYDGGLIFDDGTNGG